MRNTTEVAWAAGLFEGEGCFTFSKVGGSRSMTASLGMTDEDVVRRFHFIVGFGEVYSRKPEKTHWKPQWIWKASRSSEVQALAALFAPWFGKRRKATSQRVIRRYLITEPPSIKKRILRTGSIRAALRKGGRTQRDIARAFGMSPARVTQIKQAMELR